MKGLREIAVYIGVCLGMCLSCTSLALLGALFLEFTIVETLLGMLLAAALCICIARAISGLAKMFPTAPGIRAYTRAAFGNELSIYFTYCLILLAALFGAVETYFLGLIIQQTLIDFPVPLITSVIILATGVLNIAGFYLPRYFQLGSAVVVVTGLVIIWLATGPSDPATHAISSIVGAAAGEHDSRVSPLAVMVVLVSCVFLFTGFEWVVPLGLNSAAYRAKIPMAMILSLLILAGVYALVALSFWQADLNAATAATPLLEVADSPELLALVLIISILATISTFNAGLMGAAKLLYALAREGAFFSFAQRISFRTLAPVGAIGAICAASMAVSLLAHALKIHLAAAVACAVLYCGIYVVFLYAHLHSIRAEKSYFTILIDGVAIALLCITAFGVFLFDDASGSSAAIVLLAVLASAYLIRTAFRKIPDGARK